MMRDLSTIIVHCSYTPPDMDIGAATITEWHVDERGWDDIGYHYVITRDGAIEDGRPVEIQGAHAYGHNADSIGICLIGGMADDGETPDSNFTRWQWEALGALMEDLQGRYGPLEVIGHRDVDAKKACPCFDVKAWVAEP